VCSSNLGKKSLSSDASGARSSSGEKAALAGSELSRIRVLGGKEKFFSMRMLKQCCRSLETLHGYVNIL